MLTFIFATPAGPLASVTTEHPPAGEGWRIGLYKTRSDIASYELAQALAEEANGLNDGHTYIATDAGPHTYPQFDVVRAPQIGDAASYGFNGDYYPDGVIAKVSADFRIVTTSTGKRYFRRKLTGSWVNRGTWSLVAGRVDRRNPEI